ncbi:MAG: hypothetical protein QXT45_08075 [Candidatus Bilamarchaeaceae archaeon]
MGGAVLPIIGGVASLFGAISQQQQAAQAAGMSREALELQKRVIDAYLKEYEETRPYREGLRKLGAYMMGQKPYGWEQWTSSQWRLPTMPPARQLIELGQTPIVTQATSQQEDQERRRREEEERRRREEEERRRQGMWEFGREAGAGIDREMGWL